MAEWYDEETKKLKEAEEAAAGSKAENPIGKTMNAVRGLENSAGGKLYTGTGRSSRGNTGGNFRGKAKGFMKKNAPTVAIFGIILGVGGLLMGAQTMMPVAIEEMIIQKLNSIGVSSTTTSDVWLNTQLSQSVRTSDPETGQTDGLFAFSEYQIQQFANQGIYAVDIGSNGTALVFQDTSGTWIPVVAESAINASGIEATVEAAGYSPAGSPISASDALNNLTFKKIYTAATKSWRGGSSGWYDELMSQITETKLSIGRNRWARYASKTLGSMTEAFKTSAASSRSSLEDEHISQSREVTPEEYEKLGGDIDGALAGEESPLMNKDMDIDNKNLTDDTTSIFGIEVDSGTSNTDAAGKTTKVNNVTYNYTYDEDGNITGLESVTISGDNSDTLVTSTMDKTALQNVLESKAVKVASTAANITCGVVEGIMSIYTVASAYQSLQYLNLISGYLEAVDKVKATDDTNSPIHEYSTNLTTKYETTNEDGEGTGTKKTAIESAGMSWLFSDNAINSNDTSVRNTNFESVMANLSGLFTNVSTTAEAFEICGYVKIGTGALDLATTILSFIPGANLAAAPIKIWQVAVKVGAQIAISAAIQLAIPKITTAIVNSIIKDAATEWFGEDLGNALISGASKYLGGNGTSGGQSPGDMAKVIAYLGEQQTVIAEEAEYQRSIRSPFDITSPYTFLGSLAYSLIPMAYSSTGVMGILTNTTSILSSSITALLPTADAVDINSEILSTGDCPLLESTGAVGDAYCNPIIVTDTATLGSNPVAVSDEVHALENTFDENGKILEDSDLAKYITYCGQRTSQYGVRDAAVGDSLFEGTTGTFLGMIPGIGDVTSLMEEINNAHNAAWMTGEACVASDDNPYWVGGTDGSNNQLYQRYAENARLVESMNPGYTSDVTAYLEKYYEENPVDDSFEGTLARFAGMTKEDVEDTLALIDYYQFLADYDPSERYAFIETPEAESITFESSDDESKAVYAVLPRHIIYYDIRNRQTIG